MGIAVALEDEKGRELDAVQDPKNLLHAVLPDPEDASYQCAGAIDLYGDTKFNHLQMEKLRGEWQRLMIASSDAETIALMQRIDQMFLRCANERHLYVTFYGD